MTLTVRVVILISAVDGECFISRLPLLLMRSSVTSSWTILLLLCRTIQRLPPMNPGTSFIFDHLRLPADASLAGLAFPRTALVGGLRGAIMLCFAAPFLTVGPGLPPS